MIEASVELILIRVLSPNPREIVCRAGPSRIRVTLQQLRSDGIESVYRDQIARIGAMIRRSKDLAHSRLDRVAIRVDDGYWTGRDSRRYRTARLQEQSRSEAG